MKQLPKSIGTLALVTLIIASILGCSSTPPSKPSRYVDHYLDALELNQGEVINKAIVETKFNQIFSDFKQTDFNNSLKQAYADTFYFNDTFHSYDNIDDLLDYLQNTADKVIETKVYIGDIAQSNDDYYVRWVMDMSFEVSEKTISSRSIGITHLKFNAQGKIILHQDYWDSTDGFYQHLPIVGYVIGKAQKRL